MKTCPKCQELNSDNATECFKCHTSLKSAAASGAKKVCPHCGGIYAANVQLCPECHLPLTTYTGSDTPDLPKAAAYGSVTWLYIVSILFPGLGIVLGCIFVAKDDMDLAKSLIITGIIATFLWFFLFQIVSCACAGDAAGAVSSYKPKYY